MYEYRDADSQEQACMVKMRRECGSSIHASPHFPAGIYPYLITTDD